MALGFPEKETVLQATCPIHHGEVAILGTAEHAFTLSGSLDLSSLPPSMVQLALNGECVHVKTQSLPWYDGSFDKSREPLNRFASRWSLLSVEGSMIKETVPLRSFLSTSRSRNFLGRCVSVTDPVKSFFFCFFLFFYIRGTIWEVARAATARRPHAP